MAAAILMVLGAAEKNKSALDLKHLTGDTPVKAFEIIWGAIIFGNIH